MVSLCEQLFNFHGTEIIVDNVIEKSKTKCISFKINLSLKMFCYTENCYLGEIFMIIYVMIINVPGSSLQESLIYLQCALS